MIYIIFLIVFSICTLYILREDLETKYIPLIGFYPFVIFSIIYYYLEYHYLIGISILLIYLGLILYLDIYENIKGEISSIGKKWSFLDTGIYDYFLYLIVGILMISEIVKNFGNLKMFIILLVPFLSSIIIGTILLIMHKKKVKFLIIKENIETYDKLDENLYNRNLQKTSYIESFKNKENFKTEKQDDVFWEYRNRVPLFLYGGVFIISYIICKIYF